MDAPDPRNPVGRFQRPERFAAEDRAGWIASIEALPARLREAVSGLDERALETRYREGGWTVRQVVHHLPDSHWHAYAAFKRTLTEPEPVTMGYEEAAWADLADTRVVPVSASLAMLEALHARWAALMHAMSDADFELGYVPSGGSRRTLALVLAIYEWHGRHHLAHVLAVRRALGA